MFSEFVYSGKHLLCDFKNIKNISLLNDKLGLKLLCKNICMMHDFTILGELDHDFYPIGCSFIFLLAESHLSVHTFPEKKYISFDLYTCKQYENDDVYLSIFFELCSRLDTTPELCDHKIINRYF